MNLVRHNKTGHIYEVIGEAESTTDSFHSDEYGDVPSHYTVVIYKRLRHTPNSQTYVRECNEFYQKFTPASIEDIAEDLASYLAECLEETNYNSSDFESTRCKKNAKDITTSLLNYLKRT